jgi:hypothetical protein
MKPIEEGCRAVICKGVYKGMIVRVGRYIGVIPNYKGKDVWEIDKPVKTTHNRTVYFKNGDYLQRIDDEDTTTWEHVAETIGFIPNKQLVEQE